MIESKIIEWLDFGDSAQNLDVYSKKKFIPIFRFLKFLLKNKSFLATLNIIFIVLSFLQICSISLINVSSDKEFLLDILNYIKNISLLYEVITSSSSYINFFTIIFTIIMIHIILNLIVFFTNKKMKLSYMALIINILNVIIYYYLLGPVINILLTSTWCDNGIHKYLRTSCYKTNQHLVITILSILTIYHYLVVCVVYSFYCNEIDLIIMNNNDNNTRVSCNYEVYFLISKVSIFFFGFFFYIMDYEEEEDRLIKLLYEGFIFLNCLIMSIYTYKNVYFYNKDINFINHFGWFFCTWFTLCILLKSALNLTGVSNFITIGWIIITYVLNKEYLIKENLIITDSNIFEFNNIKSIETYKNILLKNLSNRNNSKTKILLFGINKKFEEFINNNPEINYQYQKLINDKKLIKKFNKQDSLPILSIIYILYSYYSEKLTNKNELIMHMCYYLINKLNNAAYAMFLCSKLKCETHKDLYYKYLLSEDIQDYLIFKLNKNSNKESIKHVQISSVILYYLYIDLFKIKIYDGLSNQIDYFDLLKNNSATNKTTENFLKCGESIFKTRNDIKIIWDKIIELNPFSDESHRDYMLFLETIVQDEFLAREESKKYMLLKTNKFKEKANIYHNMFLTNTSSILLVDGYLSNGKILYASPNFPYLFMYSAKELLSLTIDDLLPNCIQTFHKELMNDAIKYSNIKYIFKEPADALLKNKNNGLFNIKLFIKPVPNLSYGLIYFNYIQKMHDQQFLIILDKDLKINAFSEISQAGSSFTINNGFNLNHNILGYHIGLIIPDILLLLEYRNDEFNIIKKDYLLKGYLYPVEKFKDLKYKLDIILEKIKNNKLDINEYQGDIEDDPQNISMEFNELIGELSSQKLKPFSIFYKIKLHTFLEGKYKYYRIYINNDIISENEIKSINEENDVVENLKDKNKNYKIDKKTNKSKESKKKIKIKTEEKYLRQDDKNINNLENSTLSRHSKNTNELNNNKDNDNKENNENKDKSNKNMKDKNKEKQNGLFYLNSLNSYNSKVNTNLRGCEKIRNYVIIKKEIFPSKIMKSICYIFVVLNNFLMLVHLIQQINSFNRLSNFLNNHLYVSKIKVYSALLYSTSVNIRWLSHSLYKDSQPHLNEDWGTFYENLLEKYLEKMEMLKDAISTIEGYYDQILNKEYEINIFIYKNTEPKKSEYTLDNIFAYLINNSIKLLNKISDFKKDDCGNISSELGLDQINLKNLIEITYFLYDLEVEIFEKEEDEKKSANEVKLFIPYSFIIAVIFLVSVLFVFIFFSIRMHNIEIEFLNKLINFNSTDFDNYIKRLDEIKKKLRNDSNEEEVKDDDMDFNELDSKKKEDEYGEGKENHFDEKQNNEILEKRNNKKKMKNKQSKIQQQRRKKLRLMVSFFTKKNLLFVVKVILILVLLITYYIIFTIVSTSKANNLISFDFTNDSLNKVYTDSLKIFISLIRQVDLYEKNLINCHTMLKFYKMQIKSINEISIPKFGNLIMQISGNSELKKDTINKFSSLYSNNACNELMEYSSDLVYCENFWSGVLSKGMEQAIAQMGVIIGTVIDELQAINSENNDKTLIDIMENSAFIEYMQFNQYYLFKAYNTTEFIFNEFRSEKLSSIQNLVKKIFYFYIIISFLLFSLLIYFVHSFNNLFSAFLNFIGILPLKFLLDDEQFYYEIVKFGEKYF